MPLLGSVGDMLWCSQAEATLVHSNQIEEFCEVPPRTYLKKGPGSSARDSVEHRAIGEVISRTYIYLQLCRQLSTACACMRAALCLRSPTGPLAKQSEC